MKMKIKQISIFLVLASLATLNVFSQKPTQTPKVKPTPETVQKVSVQKPTTPVVVDGNKAKAEEFFKKGQAFWKNLDINEAIEAFTKALELYPNYVEAFAERGKIYSLIGNNEKAISDLSVYLKAQPNSVEFLNFRGMAYAALAEDDLEYKENRDKAADNAQKAETDFNQILKLDPKESRALNNRGRIFLIFGLYDEAIADLEKAISISGNYHTAYGNLALAKFYSGKGTGLTEINKAIELFGKYGESYYIRGLIYRVSGEHQKAIADFDRAIKEHDLPKYYNARAMTWFTLGDGEKAIQDFSQAINKRNDFARAYYNRAYTYKKFPGSGGGFFGYVSRMRADLDTAIKLNPNFTDALIERGKTAMAWLPIAIDGYKEEDLVKIRAIFADFDKAVKLDPKNAEAYEGRASSYEKLGKKDLALADYTKAIELNPNLATAYMGRMAIYCEMGKKELSIADEKKIKELGFATINICSLGGK
jgi:tetratricopeptide (TPR) repeat protein